MMVEFHTLIKDIWWVQTETPSVFGRMTNKQFITGRAAKRSR